MESMRRHRELITVGFSLIALIVWAGPITYAQSASSSYKVEESFFGTGGELDASSPSYKAKQSAGETTVGNSASNSYQFQGGFNTSDKPLLEVAVNGGQYDMGYIDASTTGSAVATFTVRNYLSSGYVVQLNGNAPALTSSAGAPRVLPGMNPATSSSPGTEQFGVNLVDNGNPNIGADVVQIPDNTYSFGTPISGYGTVNLFKFIDGDIIAMSPKSSGQTNYSLSMIANVARNTPAGQYGGHLSVQVIPTF